MAARWLGSRSFFALAPAAVAALVCGAARAQPAPPRIALTWTAPADCPGGTAIVTEVDRILGERGARPPTPLAVDARVTRDEGAYVVEVRTTSSGGPRSRSLRGKTCASVADATALVIALAIDPNAIPPPRPDTPVDPTPPAPASTESPSTPSAPAGTAPMGSAPAASAPAETTPAPSAPAKPPSPARAAPAPKTRLASGTTATPAPSRNIRPSYRLQAWGGGDIGSVPALTPMFGGEGGIVLVNFRIMLGGEALVPQKRLVNGVGGSVWLAAGYLDVGYTFSSGAFELGPLAGLEFGSLNGSSINATTMSSNHALWDAARVGAFAGWFPTRHLGVFTRLETAFPFSHPDFLIKGVGESQDIHVHHPGNAAGRVGVGVELRL